MRQPDIIWLQDGGDHEENHDITWCVDKINTTDTKYVRADLAGAAWCQVCGRDTPVYCDDCHAALPTPPLHRRTRMTEDTREALAARLEAGTRTLINYAHRRRVVDDTIILMREAAAALRADAGAGEPEPEGCETCEGTGEIDMRIGGFPMSGVVACPDCTPEPEPEPEPVAWLEEGRIGNDTWLIVDFRLTLAEAEAAREAAQRRERPIRMTALHRGQEL